MTEANHVDVSKDYCWVIYLHPLTFIVPDNEEKWNVDLNEINSVSYNHGELLRIVTNFKIPNSDLDGLICYDGAVAIPKSKMFSTKEDAVDFFNTFLARLLVCGFYVEGIDVRDVVNGQLHAKSLIWPVSLGYSASSQFHSKLRMRVASNIDTIMLAHPRSIKVSELKLKLERGEAIVNKIPNLSTKFLTKGVSEITYRNWDLVLSNLWIVAEQIVDFIWYNVFLKEANYHPTIKIAHRTSSLKDDTRTWSATVKQEILFQNRIISEKILENLFQARRVRNKLVHEGKTVEKKVALGLFSAINELLTLTTREDIQLLEIEDYQLLEIEEETEEHQNMPSEDRFSAWADMSGKELNARRYRK